MKKYLFILFTFFIQLGFGQNWELFPYGQKSFYTKSPRDYNMDLYRINQDSTTIIGDDKILYFDKKSPVANLQDCYDEVSSFEYGVYWEPDVNHFDSLIIKNDTTFYYDDYYGTLPFYFLNLSLPGDSWAVINDFAGPDYDSVIIFCESLDEELIFGAMDSVKTYSINSTGPTAGENIIDGMQLRLSKSFGLLEFLKFSAFFYNYAYPPGYPIYTLVGFESGGIKNGYALPGWNEYFNYQPGDLRKYHFPEESFPPINSYRLDSITSVLYTGDSIVYHYDYSEYSTSDGIIHFYTDNVETYYRNSLQYYLEENENWPLFGAEEPFDKTIDYNSTYVPIYINTILKLDSAVVPTEITDTRTFSSNYASLDITDCEISDGVDNGAEFTFDSYLGFKSYWIGSGGYMDYSINLVGARLGGNVWGDLSFPNSISENTIEKEFLVCPNPANNFIQIDIPSNKSFQYSIFTFEGKIISTSELKTNQINIENLIPGIYILELKSENQTLRGKFIKQ